MSRRERDTNSPAAADCVAPVNRAEVRKEIMTRLILTALCVAGTACAAGASFAWAAALAPENVAGRWSGEAYGIGRCEGGGCKLTLDITRCAKGWCGVEVDARGRCGGQALSLGEGTAQAEASQVRFEGRLELKRGTEPYTVRVSLLPDQDNSGLSLEFVGDTGGEFRVFRRSFPFSALLARSGDAVCHSPEEKISLAD